jgi:phosphate-selective porin
MKKFLVFLLLLESFLIKAQESHNDSLVNALKEKLEAYSVKLDGLEKRQSVSDVILDKLSKIKITGYIQAQYEMYDTWSADGSEHGIAPTTGSSLIDNSFSIRRARVKFTYETKSGVEFVLCPNFEISQVTLKDAYVRLNDRWLNTFSLWMGQFNKTTYEIEYSSASREFAERSLMTRTFYPSERDLGVKLEANLETKFKIPLQLQLAVINGNYGEGTTSNQSKDIDDSKDIMARGVYSFKMPNKGLGIDVGGHTYLGHTTIIAQTSPETVFSDVNGNSFTPSVGDKLKKELFAGEIQLHYDSFGGMSLKGEYIRGTYSGTTNSAQVISLFNADKVRHVEGYYISLIKNVGKKNVASFRYDVFDPNTKSSGNSITADDDLKYYNCSFAWQYYFDEHVKIMACYVLPTNEKSLNAGDDYITDKHDNLFTLRLQAKF